MVNIPYMDAMGMLIRFVFFSSDPDTIKVGNEERWNIPLDTPRKT